jgi:hypothetical protein
MFRALLLRAREHSSFDSQLLYSVGSSQPASRTRTAISCHARTTVRSQATPASHSTAQPPPRCAVCVLWQEQEGASLRATQQA